MNSCEHQSHSIILGNVTLLGADGSGSDASKVHLIGIGGIGVSAVARVLLARGFRVSGSDVRESQLTLALRAEGAEVTIGHRAELVEDRDLVVYSTAIPDTNPELVAARALGVPLRHRAEVLGALLPAWRSVGVIGTHGKGTVSAMITRVLDAAGRDPSFIIGGLLLDYRTNARVTAPPESGRGLVVVEIDESDGSLVHVRPDRLVVNNVEADHLNYYKDLDAVLDTIRDVLEDEGRRELAILHVGDEGVREVVRRLRKPIRSLRFGFADDLHGEHAELVARDLVLSPAGSEFTVDYHGRELGRFKVQRPGRYNAMNALGVVATGLSLDLSVEDIARGLETFSGIENRFSIVDAGRARVVKDYTSHPTGMRRVIEAARTLAPGPVVAVFKPYRFTMIHYLGDEYAVAFKGADHVVITELYTAGEVPIAGVDAPWLVKRIADSGTRVDFVPDMEAIPAALTAWLDSRPAGEPVPQVVFFGGDDLFRLADRFAASLQSGAAEGAAS